MGPSRTKHSRMPEASSSKLSAEQKKYGRRKPSHAQTESTVPAIPGVQKIKAALRQTRRLLAKEKLAADVKVATERKQKALEAELAHAERARKERALAQRYHKIKFFERQKVTRKIKQVQRQLESCTDKKEKKKLEKSVLELRVDLNYILHYPKLKKYISLFPPEVRQSAERDGADSNEKETDAEVASTNLQRQEIRKHIRERMDSGELSMEPEKEDQKARLAKSATDIRQDPAKKAVPKHVPDIAEDAFFGNDSGDEGIEEGDEANEDEDEDME